MGRKTLTVFGFLIGYFAYLILFGGARPTVQATEYYDIADIAPINAEGFYQLPDGDYYLDRPIIAKNKEQVWIVGGKNTRVFYTGAPTIGVFQYIGIRGGGIGGAGEKGFAIICQKPGVRCAVLIANSEIKGGFISSNIICQNIHVRHGGSQEAVDIGFSVDSEICDPGLIGHGGYNNENHRFINCTVESCKIAGFHIFGFQSYDITFIECAAYDAGRQVKTVLPSKQAAIDWANASEYKDNHTIGGSGSSWYVYSRNWIYGIWAQKSSSVYSIRNNFNRCNYDIFMGWPGHILHVWGHNSEHSRCFIANVSRHEDATKPEYGQVKTAATSGDYYYNIFDVRMDCEPRDKFPVVDLWGHGPWNFKNCFFTGINGKTPWFRFSNYSDKVNGAWVPLRGVIDLNSVFFKQHGGQLADYPLIVAPKNWRIQLFGIEHCHVESRPNWRPVEVNKTLQATVEN